MRIAYLCKRRYMGKDVILDRYARLYEIPRQLAARGHRVDAYCLSYQRAAESGRWRENTPPGTLRWASRGLLQAPAYPWVLLRELRAARPDLVIGASDIPHVALGDWLARRLRVPFVADLYDNFEGFGQARVPGMIGLLRRAVRRAALVVTTSEPLAGLVRDGYRARGQVWAMPSSVDTAVFVPGDKRAARRALGLPERALLIGTAGGLYADKGIGVLYRAWEQLAARRDDVHLVLAGPFQPALPPPRGERVHYIGALPHERVATLFQALDVGAICILDTAFGRYCFPQKAYEMLACALPVAASDVGAMGPLFATAPSSLFPWNDAAALADTLERQLHERQRPEVDVHDWRTLIGGLERRLLPLLPASRQ